MFNVLWIEDDALFELSSQAAPVYTSYQYHLVTAINITEAIDHIRHDGIEYDVIVVDLRMQAGADAEWARLYNEKGQSEIGIQFLNSLLVEKNAKSNPHRIELANIPDWARDPTRFAVLSIEEEKKDIIKEMQIAIFEVKSTALPRYALLNIIKRVLKNRNLC